MLSRAMQLVNYLLCLMKVYLDIRSLNCVNCSVLKGISLRLSFCSFIKKRCNNLCFNILLTCESASSYAKCISGRLYPCSDVYSRMMFYKHRFIIILNVNLHFFPIHYTFHIFANILFSLEI